MEVSDTSQDLLSGNTNHQERLSFVKSHNSKKKDTKMYKHHKNTYN